MRTPASEYPGPRRAGILVYILLTAFLARLAGIVAFNAAGLASPTGEPWQTALSIHHGTGFAFDWYGLFPAPVVGSFLPPLYPWILSGLLALSGGSAQTAMLLAQILNLLLGTLTVLILARSGELVWGQAGTDPRKSFIEPLGRWIRRHPGLCAAATYAVYPPALGHVAQAYTQTLETFLLVLLTAFMLRSLAAASAGKVSHLLTGVVLGCLLLTRPSHAIIWALWGVLLLLPGLRRFGHWKGYLLATVVAAIVLVPWTVRNHRVHGRLVPVALNGGFNFYMGNNPFGSGDILVLPRFFTRMPESEQQMWRGLTEAERDRKLYRMGLQFVKDEPAKAVSGAGNRFVSFVLFRPYLFVAWPGWLAAVIVISYLVIFVPFMLALPRCRGPAHAVPLLAIAGTLLVGLVYVVSMRFRSVVEPLMVLIGEGALRGRDR